MILLNNHGILQSAPAVPAENFLAVGAFTNYGRYSTRYMASLNLDGSLNTSFDAGTSFNNIGTANFAAKNVVEDSSGNFYVLGSFVSYKGTTANNIIKLFPDGSVDTSFNTGTGFGAVAVNCMAIDSAGKLYVGGAFTTYQGATNNRIIKLNTDGTKDTSFDNTTGFAGTVTCITIDSAGKLYVGGLFTTYKGVAANRIIKLNTDGTKDTSFDNSTGFSSGQVSDIVLDSAGNLIVIGTFVNYKSSPVNGICRIFTTGLRDTTFNSGVASPGFTVGSPYVMKLDSAGKIYVGGNFTTYNGVLNTNRIVKLNTDGSVDASFSTGTGSSANVIGLQIDSTGKIYVASVGNVNATYNATQVGNMFSLNTNGTVNSSFDTIGAGLLPGFTSGGVNTLVLSSTNKLYVLGSFTSYQAFDSAIISVNSTGIKNTSFNNYKGFIRTASGINFGGDISVILKDSSGNFYVGGTFTTYNGVAAGNMIKLFPDGSIDTSFNIGTGFDSTVTSIIEDSSGKILVGGFFTTYNTATNNNRIIRLLSNGQKDLSFDNNVGFDAGVNTMVIDSSGNIYAGGLFTTYQTQNATRLVKIDSSGTLIWGGTLFNSGVNVLKLDASGNIYAGGGFTTYKGLTNNRIIKIDSAGNKDASFDNTTGFGSNVTDIVLDSAGKLYVGGAFTTYKGVAANRIIKLNTDGTKDTSFDNTTGFDTGTVYGLYIDAAGKIYAGGSFVNYKAGGALDSYCAGMVKLNTDGSRDYSFSPTVAGFSGLVDSIIAL